MHHHPSRRDASMERIGEEDKTESGTPMLLVCQHGPKGIME